MTNFVPDCNQIINAAKNRETERLPLYEHAFSGKVVDAITGRPYSEFLQGGYSEKVEAFRILAQFCVDHGYDVLPFEVCADSVIQNGRGLSGVGESLIADIADLERFPWQERIEAYKTEASQYFDALREALPPRLKAVGGVGNGLLELVQDFVPYQELAFLQVDEPEAYEAIWVKAGDFLMTLWHWFLTRYADIYVVCRFGDDLGFKSSTLIAPDDIRMHIVPQYRRLVDQVHQFEKPFLLHSCGKIYDVMDAIIEVGGIDAKHSNEDVIDPFSVWLDCYSDRIGNFGGVDMNVLCLEKPDRIREYVTEVLKISKGRGGVAVGSGNQIADYVPPEGFLAMNETVRKWRGE